MGMNKPYGLNLRFTAGLLFFSAIACAQLKITTTSVPVVSQYQSYNTALTAAGGTPPYTWSVVSSTGVSLPEGMSLNPATGVVSATQVNGQGGYAVTVQVADSASPSHAIATATLNFGVHSDGTYGGCQMFPPNSVYNQRIDQLPVDTNPAHQIPSSSLTYPIHPDFGVGFYPNAGGLPFMRVPSQLSGNVNVQYGAQIDSAGTHAWPFPAYPNLPVEGGNYGITGDDHHMLILQSSVNNINGPQTGPCTLYETYSSVDVPDMWNAATQTWVVPNAAHYVLNSNELASSESVMDSGGQDSDGTPILPLLMKYSEVPLGAQHPLRITFPSPTNSYVWPATGCCKGSGPPQGLLYRLKANVNWQATCPVSTYPQAATVLQALQQYGAYMGDHGGAGYINGVPDDRWIDLDLACMKNFHVSDLEVVNNSMFESSDLSGLTTPYVVPATLPNGTAGTQYSATLSSQGGTLGSLAWSLQGTLPPGLLLSSSTGTISGMITSSAGSPYWFNVIVTDISSGLVSASQQFVITVTGGSPSTVAVTIASVPAGRSITVDGTTYVAPQTFSWAQGAVHALSVTSPQGTGTQYTFTSWSDGGGAAHNITVGSAATTYTANFSTSTTQSGTNTLTAVSTSVGPGGTFSVPITLCLSSGTTVDTLTFAIQITPAGGAPALAGLSFVAGNSIASPFISTSGTSNTISALWNSLSSPFSGTVTLGVVSGTIPSSAVNGQSYTVAVTGTSAANGQGATKVAVTAGSNGTVNVASTYLVGDVYPFTSDTAPHFGDGILNMLDLMQEMFAVNSVPGYLPAACSDRLGAMDVYPLDTAAAGGGDGTLDVRDLVEQMFRVNSLDATRPVRASGSTCAKSANQAAQAVTKASVTAAVRHTSPSDGALVLGDPQSSGPEEERVPVYLEAGRGLVRSAVTFGLGDQQSQLRFEASANTPPSLAQDSELGIVAAAWLEGLSLRPGQRILLGYVVGPAGMSANLKVFGMSASTLDDHRILLLDVSTADSRKHLKPE